MEKVLYIKANPKETKDSYTLQVADEFIKKYKDENTNSQVVELDLYKEGLNHVSLEELGLIFSPEENKLSKYADDFVKFDKYIIAAPMWNLSIPSILKTYIDHIAVAGKTFKYTEKGPIGLLNGKKALHITARGGLYSRGPAANFEMGDRYLKTIFAFLGITDFDTIAFESTAAYAPEQVKENYSEFVSNLGEYVEKF